MRRYLSDPALPFYRILAEWDEMDTRGGGLSLSASIDPTSTSTSTNGDAPTADAADSAYQAVLVRRTGDSTWSTVNLQMSREHGCWLIDRLWVDDQSVDPSARAAGGAVSGVDGGVDASVRIADMLADAANEAMGCRFGDYDPVQLVSWLEQDPSEELSPKMVVLNCLCALRAKDIPHRNAGCALTIRFCSPNNAASTLTPAHFAAYLEEPWYQIIAQWSEMAFHSEEMNADGSEADLVVLLKRQGDAEWTSMNWLLGRYDGLWLTERIWVDDV
ncbi:hypothetical protein JKP88DRAFT_269816 [Tribonema minus]|uniref:Uncharacterized protein n=1 Tax=Tribonema minus TaxID=303371 RepID=A0A836CF69_9STRA|nr:hypothetical protein JKP88DRAFT_269816 [Tribonema minus]